MNISHRFFRIAEKVPLLVSSNQIYQLGPPQKREYGNFFCSGRYRFPLIFSEKIKSFDTRFIEENKDKYEQLEELVLNKMKSIKKGNLSSIKIYKNNKVLSFLEDELFPIFREYNKRNDRKAYLQQRYMNSLINDKERPYKKEVTDFNLDIMNYAVLSIFFSENDFFFISGNCYRLIETPKENVFIQMNGKKYGITYEKSITDMENEFMQNLEASVSRNMASLDSEIAKIETDKKRKELLNKNEYFEDNFGFEKKGNEYHVFFEAPIHIYCQGSTYYKFDPVRVYINIPYDEKGIKEIYLDYDKDYCSPFVKNGYKHPFVFSHGKICYDHTNTQRKINKNLKTTTNNALRAAKILIMGLTGLKEGYLGDDEGKLNPVSKLKNFTNNIITEAEKKRIESQYGIIAFPVDKFKDL